MCHPKSSYVTTKLYGTSIHVDATIMRSFQTEQFSRFLPSPYAATLNWPRQSIESFENERLPLQLLTMRIRFVRCAISTFGNEHLIRESIVSL